MKLWKKISLLCGAVLIIVLSVCCGILLVRSQQNALELARTNAKAEHQALDTSFTEMTNYYLSRGDSEVVEKSLARYCFGRFAGNNAVLEKGGVTVFSHINISPSELIKLDNSQLLQKEISSGSNHILLTGSLAYIGGSQYEIYTVTDLTPVYASNARTARQFVLIGMVGLAIGLALMIFIVRRSMKPLGMLKATSRRIADGNYSERAAVSSADEIGELAEDFNKMAHSVETHIAELTEQTERQRLFIGGVTHEFKTPITALILNADTVLNTALEEEERNLALYHIWEQSKWLERLVQKLLRLITLNEELEVADVPVERLFENVRESTREALMLRGVTLETKAEAITLPVEEDLMHSVLVNLVDNAAKASESGGTVILAARKNMIEVRDFGRGIPEEEIPRITEPFYMVDRSRSKKQGGSGIGLALVKEIVSAHGARLEIESSLGSGTAVRIFFDC